MAGGKEAGRNILFGEAHTVTDAKFPATGTAQFLKLLSPDIPDTFINELVPRHRGCGRRQQLNAAQLYRANLLSVLTPVHAFNHAVRLLAEQRDWGRFAQLSNRQAVPEGWMLNRFRERCCSRGVCMVAVRLRLEDGTKDPSQQEMQKAGRPRKPDTAPGSRRRVQPWKERTLRALASKSYLTPPIPGRSQQTPDAAQRLLATEVKVLSGEGHPAPRLDEAQEFERGVRGIDPP
jgi:hypothetical protein